MALEPLASSLAVEPVSVIVPVRNEIENVGPLIAEIAAALGGVVDYEIIYVDDGSSDGTYEALMQQSAVHPTLRVMRHLHSCGQSTAVLTGVRAAQHPWIATLDGDGQNDPADIPALLAARGTGQGAVDLICGYRRKRRDTWLKRLSSRIANGVRSNLLRDRTPDTGCGLKVFSRDLFLRLPYFDHMHRFLPALVLRAGGKIVSVEVNHRPRVRGKSNYGVHNRLWVGIVDLFGVMWLLRRAKLPTVVESEQHGA